MSDEDFKLKKIDELVALRTSIIHVLIVLIGGTIGLLLTVDNIIKVVLICLGIFYTVVLIFNLINITHQLNKILTFRKETK
ncbi:MAG: hypothetical protein PHC64_05645 [Candidatus Gastranaerophilales bacterium]|nr:hypothetical protein [Candidatus Gastranaerophilales bacterium]